MGRNMGSDRRAARKGRRAASHASSCAINGFCKMRGCEGPTWEKSFICYLPDSQNVGLEAADDSLVGAWLERASKSTVLENITMSLNTYAPSLR